MLVILQATENCVSQKQPANTSHVYLGESNISVFPSSGCDPVAITSWAEAGNVIRQCREMRQMCTYALGSTRAVHWDWKVLRTFCDLLSHTVCVGLKVLPLGLHMARLKGEKKKRKK